MSLPVSRMAEQRMNALRNYNLLEASSCEPLDSIVRLAAQLCDTPMAAASVNDHSRERFLSCHGFTLERIPAAKGFSDYVISGGTALLVNDTRTDKRFPQAPLLSTHVKPRFYAGVPIITCEGVAIGTLAVMDKHVRHLPHDKLDALHILSRQAALMLETAVAANAGKVARGGEGSVAQIQVALKTVFSALPGVHWLTEPLKMTVVAISPDALPAFSLGRKPVLGRPINEVLVPSDDEQDQDSWKQLAHSISKVAETGEADNLVAQRYCVRHDDGFVDERYWNVFNTPVRDATGALVYVVSHAEDVTELVSLREREDAASRTRNLLEGRAIQLEADILRRSEETARLNEHLYIAQSVADVGSWELNADGALQFCSNQVYTILGRDRKSRDDDEDIILDAVHPDDRAALRVQRAAALRGAKEMDIVHRVVWPDGAERFVSQQSRLVRGKNGEPLKLYGSIQDITRQKQIEDEVRTRARQQEVVARLGQKALTGIDLETLWDEAVKIIATTLDVEYCKVLQLLPDHSGVKLVAGVGWQEGLVGNATVGIGSDSQAGYTLQTEGTVIVKDLRSETRFSGPPLLHDHGVVSGISVIIAGRDEPWGVLGAHTTRSREFSKDDVNFFESVANIVAEATHRARANAENLSRAQQHDALLHLTRVALQGRKPRDLQELAARLVTDVLDVEYSNVKELLPDGSGIKVVAGRGWKRGVVGHSILSAQPGSHSAYVIGAAGKVITAVDLPNEARFRPSPLMLEHAVDSSISVAIMCKGKPWGLLGAYTGERRWFTAEETIFMQDIAALLGDVQARAAG